MSPPAKPGPRLRARTGPLWVLLCWVLGAQGCAWLVPTRIEAALEQERTERFVNTSRVADSLQTIWTADVEGLQVRLRAATQERCLAEQGRRIAQVKRTTQQTQAWAWAVWSAEVLGLGALVANRQPGTDSWALALALPVAVDALLLARTPRGERTEPAETLTLVDAVQVSPCEHNPRAGLAVHIRGDRGERVERTDPSGQLLLLPATWPRAAFPYQQPLATATCVDCPSLPIALTAEDGATLVLSRNELEDYENWILLHGTTARAGEVTRARDAEAVRLRALAHRHLEAARLALGQGELMSAAAAVRACQQVSRLPTPDCDALLQTIIDTFVGRQLVDGEAAARRADLPALEVAAYRCRLMERQRPACARLDTLLTQARASVLQARMTKAIHSQDLAQARAAAEQCLTWLGAAEVCARLTAQLEKAQDAQRKAQASQLAAQAWRAWSRRQRAQACELANQCLTLEPAAPRCRKLAERCQPPR